MKSDICKNKVITSASFEVHVDFVAKLKNDAYEDAPIPYRETGRPQQDAVTALCLPTTQNHANVCCPSALNVS